MKKPERYINKVGVTLTLIEVCEEGALVQARSTTIYVE